VLNCDHEGELLELADGPSLPRRILTGFAEIAAASFRPLRRKTIRWRLLRDYLLFYIVIFLWLHFIGYRSWHPEIHRVRETVHQAAISAIYLALLATILSYFALLRERDWL